MRVSLAAWLDPQFWRWAAWFWLNSLMPGWADFNHQSHRYCNRIKDKYLNTCFLLRLLALYSLKCQEEEEERLGEQISCGKTALETLRLLTSSKEKTSFLIFFLGCSPAPKRWPPSLSLIKLSSGRTPAIPSLLSRQKSAGPCVHQMISEIDPQDLTRFYV